MIAWWKFLAAKIKDRLQDDLTVDLIAIGMILSVAGCLGVLAAMMFGIE